jgi:hypothetical protein
VSGEPYEPRLGDYIRVQGNSRYLPVPARVQWMRGDHPDWTISTDVYALDWTEGWVIMRADVRDASGRLIAQGTKHETRAGFGDFIEKAETGAVGRALARAGYGTEDALDLEGERLADAPAVAPTDSEHDRGAPASYPRGHAPAPRSAEEDALLDELLAVPGMTKARLSLLAETAKIPTGRHATADELRAMLALAVAPPRPGPEGWPRPNSAAFGELSAYERATARAYWQHHPTQETTSDE